MFHVSHPALVNFATERFGTAAFVLPKLYNSAYYLKIKHEVDSDDGKPSKTKNRKTKAKGERKRVMISLSSDEDDVFNSSPIKDSRRHTDHDSMSRQEKVK